MENTAVETFPLDDAMISMLAEINQQVQTLQAQANGALILFLRQHKLEGDWRVAPNQKELIRPPALQEVPSVNHNGPAN